MDTTGKLCAMYQTPQSHTVLWDKQGSINTMKVLYAADM